MQSLQLVANSKLLKKIPNKMAYEKVENLLWLDMEMSGLDVNKEAIIEVACIVTDMNFRELDTFETVVKQPQSYLDSMGIFIPSVHII